ncbi:pentatricopeptide repeat-containing protein At3g49170, chloroplastic-like isoform X3 [Zingiber officinale]|uniref:pentatricopeptide repeat-containing protein At3g49170, chloroplastic-like isoform X3 n=1 Tax=Zingiber officinale TaxID=94328 RepID=UPI001C4BF390|nr:pentatricopeptide repeat-containing protein At3g49170, chloroplastic-like isoform X3 [Zingiber officinale]
MGGTMLAEAHLAARFLPSNPSIRPPRRSNPTATSVSFRRVSTRNPSLEALKDRLIRLADSGRIDDALSTLDLMADRGIPADLVSYSVLLRSCIRSRDLRRGRLVQRRLLDSGLQFDSVVTNSLISLYSKCGEWEAALSIFEEMGSRRDVVSWTALVSYGAQNGMQGRAIAMFCQMLETGIIPNEFSFCSVIQACSKSEYLWIGRAILGFVVKMGFFWWDASVGCALIAMFAENDDLLSARKVFDGILERNAVVWTLMISSDLESLEFGRQMHSQAIRLGLAHDACVGCTLVDMYAKCSLMDDSRKVFDRMDEHSVMSWTTIISGYAQSSMHDEKAIELFINMINGSVRPNHFTYSSILKACANLADSQVGQQIHARVIKSGLAFVNFVGNSLVSMYARFGRMEEAIRAFDSLYEKNVVSCNAIADGCAKNYNYEQAIEVLYQIQSMDMGANAFTFASLLSAAASIGMLSKGQQLHAQLLKAGLRSDMGIGNSLISMYSRCGSIDDACQAFGEMNDHNVISWTAMITGFAKQGDADQALKLYQNMVSAGVKPNAITYVAVLSSCSHAGLVEQGWEHFHAMQKDHRVAPTMEHYACMVDLLGRSGLLEDAFKFINSMPLRADVLVWRTLLGGCSVHGDIRLGEIAAKRILELAPEDPAAYVLLSNMYAEVGRWEDVATVRHAMKERNLNKEAGLSWIEVENIIHKFHVGDTSHPQAQKIYAKLDELFARIKEMGYVPNTNFVLHDIEDHLKEQYLLQHSEKIAVAFGLINTSGPKPIRVFKNLRVCGDCHNAIKCISKATGRDVILRDSNRFHHIRNGVAGIPRDNEESQNTISTTVTLSKLPQQIASLASTAAAYLTEE